MNQGFFGFPQNTTSTVVDIKEFDSSGTYSIPYNAKRLWITLLGAGSGGGGGARQASGIFTYGGGGGGGGTINTAYYWVDSLALSGETGGGLGTSAVRPGSSGKTLTIVLGAGGTGGAAATGDTSNGGDGGRGGDSFIRVTGTTGNMMYSYGGANYGTPYGSGGTTTSSTGGNVSGVSGYPMINGIASANTTTTYSGNGASIGGNTNIYMFSSNGGCSGSLIDSGNNITLSLPVNHGVLTSILLPAVFNPYWVSDNLNATIYDYSSYNSGIDVNTSNLQRTMIGAYSHGIGGTGGRSYTNQAATNGQDGYRGSGGGGGGGSRNGFAAGKGGAGGDGYCLIVALG